MSNDGDGTGGTTRERIVVRGGGVPIQYPMLDDTNYGLWTIKMKIILRALGV